MSSEYTRSQMREIRRKRRRRRIIQAWCARAIFLLILTLILVILVVLVKTIISLASNEKSVQPVVQEEVIVAPVIVSPSITIEIETNYIEREEIIVTLPREEIEEPRISAYEAGEQYFYELTEQDKVYIAYAVHEEARGESFVGQVAVAAVILNRYVSDDPFFENDSIYSVITQDSQFADISEVTQEDLANHPDCMRAVEAAAKGWDPTREIFEDGAKYFFEPEGLSDYQKMIRTGIEEMIIGNHHFHNDFADID